MISSRLPCNREPNALARLVQAKRRAGAAIADLTESNPTRAGLSYPDDLLAPLADPRALEYDPQPLGLWSARAAVAADFRRRGIVLSADRVALTSSTSEAYALLFKLLCDAGDQVLVPHPSYPLFEHLTQMESVTAVPYSLEYHGAWRIDLDSVRAAAGDRLRAILVVSPNNPTGSFLHRDDLAALAELAAARNVPIIGDEVFADYRLDPAPASTHVLAAGDVLAFSLGGLSKSAGLPQLKLGWMAFGGPSALVDEAIAAYEIVADTYLSVATPVQAAAAELIECGAAIRAQILARLKRNLDALRAQAASFPAVAVLPVEGGWSAVLQVPSVGSEESLILSLLDKDDVLVHPGYFFDFPREAFIVVSLLVEPAVFDKAIALVLPRGGGPVMMRRQSGIAVPLASLVSNRSWGIGEFIDLAQFAGWLTEAGQAAVQLLPIHEMPPLETSPYSAMTAMALDPIYLSVPDVPDFDGLGGDEALDGADRAEIARLRQSPRLEYVSVRRMKDRWLRRAFDRFLRLEVARGSPRAVRFDQFMGAQAWWLDEYAVFRSLHVRHDERPWTEWPHALASADANAVEEAQGSLHSEITYRAYLQWLAQEQWAEARRRAWPVRVFGDLPFMIAADSPDVWARQGEFRFDATVGVPPDAFSEAGQDWGLPPWRAHVMREGEFNWMKNRARRYAGLYDGYRIDHLVGLYRMYVRPIDKSRPALFEPRNEAAQTRLGETLVNILRGTTGKVDVFAEDLGSIPAFVRESMTRLRLPGVKVLRWEKHWDREGQPAIDPATFPELSVATTGTHDIEPLAATPEGASDDQRTAVLRSLLSAGSALTLLPVQDVFGWTDRINTPAVVDDINWTWRVPWPVDTWLDRPDAVAHADALKAWTRDNGR